MSFQYSSFGVVLLISAIIVLSLSIYSYKKRSSTLHIYFIFLMLSSFFWCLGSSMEFFSVEMWLKIFWIKISYLGVATAASLWFTVVLSYCKYEKYLKPQYIGILMLLPLIVIIMAFTNELHLLLWPNITPSSNLPGALLIYDHGPLFWISIIYNFSMILAGIILLIQIKNDYPKPYHPQIYILLLSGFIPLIFSILYTTNTFHIPGLDITPFGLTISGLLLALAIFKFNFLDIPPIAHKTLFKSMKNGFMVFDKEDKLIEVNPAADIIGIDTSSIGKNVDDVLEDIPDLKSFYKKSESESEIFLGNSFNKWIQAQITPIYDDNIFYGSLLIVQDVNNRKRVEKELIESEERYKTLTEFSPDAIAVIIENIIVFANNASSKLLGAKNIDEIIGKSILNFIHPEFKEISKKRLYAAYIKRKPLDFLEEKIIDLEGNVKYIEIGDIPIMYNNKPAVQIVVRDITGRKKLENELKKSLEEKDMMLKEIHHRVKNNLMVIESLLNLQSHYIKDKTALNIFKESQNRAKSMALIHQRLYQSNDLKRIEFGEYSQTLARDLFHSYSVDPNNIKMNIDTDKVMLDVNIAIPLGLILNELISNSLKHAFPEDKKGQINVEFHTKEEKFELSVSDDGIGIPQGFDYKKSDSLGLMLVHSLSDQIRAEVKMDVTNGTKFKITFKEDTHY